MAKTKKLPPKKRTWRDNHDATHRTFTTRPDPESLHPGPDTVLRAIAGQPEARSIIASYAFRFPVTVLEVIG